ncbi:MAG: hypothetical protein ABIQ35_11690, partial [Verrucomicrobiota bacterium]
MKIQILIRRIARAALIAVSVFGIQTLVEAQGIPQELALDHQQVKAVIAVQKAVTSDMMKLPGILGTAVGADDNNATALVIYVDQDSPSRAEIVHSLPPQIRGIGVKVEVTEKFRAFRGKPVTGGGVSHTAKQTAPIQLGTSGGWRTDLANGYCCGGTLGSLVQVNGVQYILSNYHVLESDIVSGGNGVVATTG